MWMSGRGPTRREGHEDDPRREEAAAAERRGEKHVREEAQTAERCEPTKADDRLRALLRMAEDLHR